MQRLISWHPAKDRWHNQTGVSHALGNPDRNGQAGPLCGAKVFYLGGGYATPEEAPASPCKRCLRIAAKATGGEGR